ncbi:MAG: arginine--tRNA ligase, partial [Anaerobacillus sp.]
MNYKTLFGEEVYQACEEKIVLQEIIQRIEQPKYEDLGDYAFPCFDLAKIMRMAPNQIAADVASKIQHPLFEKIEAVGPYINVFLEKTSVAFEVVKNILGEGSDFGTSSLGKGDTITIDLSSP